MAEGESSAVGPRSVCGRSDLRVSVASYKEVRLLSPHDAAYIAGLIDGEGSILLTRRHRGDHRQLVITIREPLKYFRGSSVQGRTAIFQERKRLENEGKRKSHFSFSVSEKVTDDFFRVSLAIQRNLCLTTSTTLSAPEELHQKRHISQITPPATPM